MLVLASWFRLKYPHIVIGALASSAPILYFEDITPHDGYGAVVTKDFRVWLYTQAYYLCNYLMVLSFFFFKFFVSIKLIVSICTYILTLPCILSVQETSENCYSTIRESWFEIDKVAAQTNGLMNLSNIFATCMYTRIKTLVTNLKSQYNIRVYIVVIFDLLYMIFFFFNFFSSGL